MSSRSCWLVAGFTLCLLSSWSQRDLGALDGAPPTDVGLFVRGDVNMDGHVGLDDAVMIVCYLYVPGAPVPKCTKAADFDDDGHLGVTDAIRVLNYLLLSGPCPEAPFPDCGMDATRDGLDCASSNC